MARQGGNETELQPVPPADPWASLNVGVDDDDREANLETTPLNSPEKRSRSPAAHGITQQRIIPQQELSSAAAGRAADAGRAGKDLRFSRNTYILFVLFTCAPLVDAIVLFEVVGLVDWSGYGYGAYGTSTRDLARIGQLGACAFTICIAVYSIHVVLRWQVGGTHSAAMHICL